LEKANADLQRQLNQQQQIIQQQTVQQQQSTLPAPTGPTTS
jgi:hypothetical protein